jgi:phage gpG-like protein
VTLDELAARLLRLEPTIQADVSETLRLEAGEVAKKAQGYLGTYQPGWPPLKPETIARKVAGDTPLLETGLMRGRTTADAAEPVPGATLTLEVGSAVPYAVDQELGTSTIPPRPFLSLALTEREEQLEDAVDLAVDRAIDEALGL